MLAANKFLWLEIWFGVCLMFTS